MNLNKSVLNVIKNILPTILIAISFFIIGRVTVSSKLIETKNNKLSPRNTVVVLPEFTDTLNSPDILRVSSVIRKEDGTIDSVFLKHFGNPVINIPHPKLTFVAVDIRKLTIYTRSDKTLHFGYTNLWDISSELSYLFPHQTEFRRKLIDDEKKEYKIE